MKGKLLVVLFLSALLICCFAWVYARHADQNKGTTITKDRPSSETLMELRKLAKQIKPDMAPILDVKLEDMPPLPHQGTVQKVALDQLTPDRVKQVDPEQTMQHKSDTAVPVSADATVKTMRDGQEIERSLTECLIFVHDINTCCYYHPDGELEWACWGQVAMATWNDPQQNATMSNCGYPIYPFEVQGVEIEFYTADTSTMYMRFGVMDYYWDHCSPYPGEVLYMTEPIKFDNPSGFVYFGAVFDPPICVYDRFFAFAELLNSDDFLDPDYCPDAPYQFQPSAIFDQSGWCERSYWIYGGYWQLGYWYDAVCELPAYGMGWPGVVRIRGWGATADENTCPDSFFIWQKEGFYEEDTLGNVIAYAPSGVPDFNQKQKEEMHPEIDAPWDGPTALANCLWWMAAADMIDPFWDDSDADGENWDPDEVPNLINLLAGYMNFGNCGVTPAQMDEGLDSLKNDKVLWFTHEEIYQPTWEQIEYNIRISQNVLLLLGFWWQDTSGAWFRIGGHWITCAGVDYIHGLLKISDPDLDINCLGQGIYLPHDHFIVPYCHNDAGNVAHDIYPVMESITPCGVLMFAPDVYPWWDLDLNKYLGHNFNPQCPYPVPEFVPPPPIWVEIEAAKIICPESPFRCETIWAYRGGDWWTGMVKCNYGREGAQDTYAFWWDPYGNALFDGSYIFGNHSSNLAFFGGDNDPAGEYWPYEPMNYVYYYFPGKVNPQTDELEDLGVNLLTTSYFHNQPKDEGLPLDINLTAIAWDDYDDDPSLGDNAGYGAGRLIIQVWIIHNRGLDPIDSLRVALWLDWDLHPDAYLDHGIAFEEINWGGQYNIANPDTSFGVMFVPIAGEPQAERFAAVDNGVYVHPNAGWGWDRDSLWNLMNGDDWNTWDTTQGPYDMSTLLTTEKFSIQPCHTKIIVIIKDSPEREAPGYPWYMKHWFTALKFMGFYRGDANCDGSLNLSDVIYIANYYFGKGPKPKPFIDQADANYDFAVNLSDVIYIANYYFGKGPAPIDYARFSEMPFGPQPSLFTVPGFSNLGQP